MEAGTFFPIAASNDVRRIFCYCFYVSYDLRI